MYFEHLVVANILRKSVASNLISCVHISFQHQFISNLKLEHVLMSKLFTLLKKISFYRHWQQNLHRVITSDMVKLNLQLGNCVKHVKTNFITSKNPPKECLVNNCSDILGNVMSFDKLVVYFNLVRLLRWCVHKVRFIYFKYAVVYLLQFLSLFDITEWSIALSRINCWTTCKTNWFILKPGWIIWRAEPAQVFDLPWKLTK